MKTHKNNKRRKYCIILVITLLLTCIPTTNSSAATTDSEQQFRTLYANLLENGDNSIQDISSLELPYMTCYNIMEDVKKTEGFLAYQCYKGYNLLTVDLMETKENVPYLSKFHLSQTDTEFKQRYETVQKIIADVQKNIDAKMTDLDKLLLFHEYVVANIYYNNTNTDSVHLGGTTLAQGYGVCEGYAYALMVFLKAENIPCEEVAGGAHSWVAVKLDDEWYHVDPTWDDTCSAAYGTHYFLLRNDDELYTTLTKKHATGKMGSTFLDQSSGSISTSTKYSDWYVHNVWNQMYYYDGYWYYVLNNAVRKNNILGTDESILFEGTKLSLSGITDGTLTFFSNGEEMQLDLGKKTDVNDDTEITTPETPPDNDTETTTPETPSDSDTDITTPETPSDNNTETTTPETPSDNTPAENNKIKVGKPTIKSVTNKKGQKIKIVLKKKVSGANGYEVKICKDKKFQKSVKTVRFSKTTKTISKFRKNKTYYVKVRAYKKDSNGNRVYGPYSNVKKVKIKK